jgi:hypothetical protein
MTTLGQQIVADIMITHLRAIIGASIAAMESIDSNPADAENELTILAQFITEKLDAASKGIIK